MAEIRFDDGASYERMMGVWSRLAGEIFLDWLAPPKGLRWVDVGCGNGAFTELLVERCAPVDVQGIDPSEGQLAFARTRPAARLAKFRHGDAMALPFPADSFDAAVMALVLVFVPDPPKGVAEMVRVVSPGGTVATYMWDMLGGGFPLDPVHVEMRAMGLAPPRPSRMDASTMPAMQALWIGAGSRPWRPARFRYSGPLRISTNSGRSTWRPLRSLPSSPQWSPQTLKRSRVGCARVSKRMGRDA
jgi:SAM-dependent methyltransferase